MSKLTHYPLVAHPRDGGGIVVTLTLQAADAGSALDDPWGNEGPTAIQAIAGSPQHAAAGE